MRGIAELLLLVPEVCLDRRDNHLFDRLRGEFPALLGDVEFQGEKTEDPFVEPLEIPLLGVAFLIDILRDEPFGHLLDHLFDIIPEGLPLENLLPLFVDDLTLAVHDVVILEQMLADIEILSFHTFLGILDRPGDQPVFDRLSLFHADPVHDGGDSLCAENAQEIVFEGKIEPRRPHVSLPSRTAAELVVDTAALVPLGSEDMQPPELRHPLSQFDVRSASGHVCGNGHLSGLSGLRDDLRLAFMILCVQHVVLDPRPGQIFAQEFRFFDGDRPHENGSLRLMQLADLLDDRLEFLLLRSCR